MFLNWASSHKEVGKGYKSFGETMDRREALAFIPQILHRIALKKGTSKPSKSYSYYMPRPFGSIVWLAPIRSRPLRTYDSYRVDYSPEGEHTPYLIKKYLSRRTKEQQRQAGKFIKFIQRFGRESGLFRSIAIREYDRRSKTSPFELDIILTDEALSVDNVGYGVSQCLPVIVEIFVRVRDSWFAIQQPEIHLHPRAQVAIGDVIFELAVLEKKRFIIETHSDFILDSYRLNYSSKKYRNRPDSQIVFFERTDKGNVLYDIKILENGEISDNQPEAYRSFFLKEQMRLLGL
jgi:predicted ATPase